MMRGGDSRITHELRILGHAGDTRLTWDVNDPASRENARAEVARLKAAGYLFFMVDGTPADEVAAGNGELVARYATEADLLEPQTAVAATEAIEAAPSARRRGRPPKAQKAVAVRPMAGG